MSESNLDRKIDALIEDWQFSGTRNPVFNRIQHMTDAEIANASAPDQYLREQRYDCHCAPRGFISTPRAEKERMRAEHIAKGEHEAWCPMFCNTVNPMYSRAGDVVPPSYTQAHARRDEEAERVEYGHGAGRFRQTD